MGKQDIPPELFFSARDLKFLLLTDYLFLYLFRCENEMGISAAFVCIGDTGICYFYSFMSRRGIGRGGSMGWVGDRWDGLGCAM